MPYSAFDLDTNGWFATGRNSSSLEECKQAIREFLEVELEGGWEKLATGEILTVCQVEIRSHIEVIPETVDI